MNVMLDTLAIFVSALVVENLVFARALGMDGILSRTRKYSLIAWSGGLMAAVSVLGGILSWTAVRLMGEWPVWATLRYPILLLCLSLGFLAVWFAVKKGAAGRRLRPSDELIVSAAFNGAAFGAVLLALNSRQGLWRTVVYCLGCAAGLTAAMLLVHSGRERLALSSVPRAFRGLPVTLIYIGILSLAVYGLIGHQLPT